MSYHDLETFGSVHIPYNWEYANAAARTGATGLTSDDNGKWAWQKDNNTTWLLVDYSGPTWKQVDGTGGGADGNFKAEILTYTDTGNEIIGPLASAPSDIASVNLDPIDGILQEESVFYTCRQVTGGSAPGYYICISPTSSAPGGGSFAGGSNPGSGMGSLAEVNDKFRVSYPTT